jgi:hypothetical protein
VQSVPHETPVGLLSTTPLPVPVLVTVRVNVCEETRLKVAVQVLFAVIVTEPSRQSASPLQPANVDPAVGAAVSVTTVPLL